MESDSVIYTSPSFNRDSSNNIADIADRVVQQLRIENGFHDEDEFNFSDDEIPADISGQNEVKSNTRSEIVKENDEHDFEFPVVCLSPVTPDDIIYSDDLISPKYPLFDRSLMLEGESNLNKCVNTSEIESVPDPAPTQTPAPAEAPATRLSLAKLFSEDRDSPTSSSSSESDYLDGITPGTYCVWKPEAQPQPETQPRRNKHKKSNSISIGNTSNRWKVRDLLKRSYSDDSYSVSGKDSLLFSPPITPNPKTCSTGGKDSPVISSSPPIIPKPKTYSTEGKDPPVIIFSKPKTNNEKVKKIEKTVRSVSSNKMENRNPAYRTKIGNIRLPPYLPYREDQLAAFANFNGAYRY